MKQFIFSLVLVSAFFFTLFTKKIAAQNRIEILPFEEVKIENHALKWQTKTKEGRELRHGQALEITFPEKFWSRRLNYVRIHFRKDPRYLTLNPEKIDKNGAYISLSCQNDGQINDGLSWHTWKDQFGAEKFATAGGPENLNRNIFNNIQNLVGDFPIRRIRLTNNGRGNTKLAIAQIHYIECSFLKPEGDLNEDTQIFHASVNHPQRVKFSFDEKTGKPMKIGEAWQLKLPEKYVSRPINYMIVRFRQSEEKIIEKADPKYREPDPAKVLVQVADGKSGLLWPWYDRYGTEKYVEPRTADDPENENLHDCQNCFPGIDAESIVLENVGYGAPEKSIAFLYSLEVLFLPETSGASFKEIIFTGGTKFSNHEMKLPLPEFTGGPRFAGKYPDSLMIGVRRYFRTIYQNKNPSEYFFPTATPDPIDGYIDSPGRLHLFLPAGKRFRQIEISAGDVDNTILEKNKDGHFGRLGWAELYCYFKSADSGRMRLISDKANVGPEGIIVFSPDTGDIPIQPGDELIIESRLDVCFIMGLRLLLAD